MTGPDTDRLLRAYLEEGPAVLPDRTIDSILDVVARTPRRTGGAWRTIRMPRFALAAAVAVVIAVVGGVTLLPRFFPPPGNEPTSTPPASSPSSPSTSPAAPGLPGGIIVFTRRLPGEDDAHLFSVMPNGTRFEQVRPEPACCVALPAEGGYVIFGITGGPTLTIGETNPYGGNEVGLVPNDGTVYPAGLDLIPRAVSLEFEIAFESPDGVWMSRSNGGRFVYGTFEQLATPDRGHDIPVAFSPDGSKLLFIREGARAGFGNLFVVDQAGGDIRQLNPAGVEVPVSDLFGPGASWSPNSSRVAFAGHLGKSGSSRVYVADIATAQSTAITGAANWTTSARWSPTNDRIVFDVAGVGGPHDLFIVNADGTGAVEITGDLESPCCAVWSPSGTHLLLTSGGEDEQHTDLWIVAADGSGLTRLTNQPAEYQGYAWGRGV